MNKIKIKNLIKLLLILLIVLTGLFIVRECKITSFCLTIFNLLSPIFIGYVIAWLLKPIMNYFNRRYNRVISVIITYLIIILFVGLFSYYLIPIVIDEVNHIIPIIGKLYNSLPLDIKSRIDITKISYKLINITVSVKDVFINIFYSIFISYYFLFDNKLISKYIGRYTPNDLVCEISSNLKLYVRGTLIDTIILFVMSIIALKLVGMPYSLFFAILISITNIIPYVGPYIGGIPCILMALTISYLNAFIVLVIVFGLQFIESVIIHPIIMSKSLNIHPIIILIGLIFFGYFFGIIGMVISTPMISIIKSLYMYYKPFRIILYK